MEKEDIKLKYNYILKKFKELFHDSLIQIYSSEDISSMDFADYIFKTMPLFPTEKKAFELLRYLYIDNTEDLVIRTYDLMNLYNYMKGVIKHGS